MKSATAHKRIENLESFAHMILHEATELKRILPGIRPGRPPKGKQTRTLIYKRLKSAVK